MRYRTYPATSRSGFTLIELSIVLVIIGLIVGGVLVGQDLIEAANIRAQISQLEKYNTAVRTFQIKYNCLPGDCANAANFGFPARGSNPGQGDGNGVIEGYSVGIGWCPSCQNSGEAITFWVDLSMAALIEGSFTLGSPSVNVPGTVTAGTNPGLSSYYPSAKIGHNNSIYVWGDGISGSDGINYFTIATVTSLGSGSGFISTPGLSAREAYAIDTKIDDGLPQSGRMQAIYVSHNVVNITGAVWAGAADTSATAGTASTCYDNGNIGGAIQHYSTEISGAVPNCALSVPFQ